jgi:hypothetical protein
VFSHNGSSVYVFTVSGPERFAYTWDVLGNGVIRHSDINRIVSTDLPTGNYTVTVTMDGTKFSSSFDYYVIADEKLSVRGDHIWIAVAAGLMAVGAAGAILRRRNNNP